MEGSPSLEVPRGTGSEGGLESSREAVRVTRIGDEAPTPVIVPTPVVRRREFLGSEDTDSDKPLPIPYRLKGKGRGTVNTPIELSTDDESNKENRHDEHPREDWFVFDPNNQEHYVVAVEDAAGDVHAAWYIKYVMTEDGPMVHGCDGKGTEVLRNPYRRVARTRDPTFATMGKSGTTSSMHSPPLPNFATWSTAMSTT